MIENPEYKGEWKAKQIPNPNYFVDENPHNFDKLVIFNEFSWKSLRIFLIGRSWF